MQHQHLIYGGQGSSLLVQWLARHASTAGGTSLIRGQGTKILQATWHGQKKKKLFYDYFVEVNTRRLS